MISAPPTGWVAMSCSSNASAAGQSEQPSEVKSSTRIGVDTGAAATAWCDATAPIAATRTTMRTTVRRTNRILSTYQPMRLSHAARGRDLVRRPLRAKAAKAAGRAVGRGLDGATAPFNPMDLEMPVVGSCRYVLTFRSNVAHKYW